MNKATSVRAGESVSRQCPNLFTFVDAREMVSGPCPVSAQCLGEAAVSSENEAGEHFHSLLRDHLTHGTIRLQTRIAGEQAQVFDLGLSQQDSVKGVTMM